MSITDQGHKAGTADLSSAVLAIMRLSRALERTETGLTPPQYRILKLAGAAGERSTRLAQRLAGGKRTLAAIADVLVAAGYAIREAEPGDRRVVRLSLTPAGRAALERADTAYAAWLGPLLAPTGEPAAVLRALDLIDAALTRERQARHEANTGHETGRKNHEHAH